MKNVGGRNMHMCGTAEPGLTLWLFDGRTGWRFYYELHEGASPQVAAYGSDGKLVLRCEVADEEAAAAVLEQFDGEW